MLRVVFMGTPDFSVPTLEGLIAAGHTLVAAYSQPPRPAGRGMAERKSPVHEAAERAGIPVLTPRTLKNAEAQSAFSAHAADVAVVVAYGLILPAPILAAPRHGCLNLHASALPRWRGAAPIQRAIMAGDSATAASIMRMDEGLDTGPVCLEELVPIGPDTTAGELHDTLSARGAALMVQALAALERGALRCAPQPDAGATYAPKIGKDETRIDFTRPAAEVHNHIRGLSPAPGAWLEMTISGRPERLKVLRTRLVAAGAGGPPGRTLDPALTIACGTGAIRIEEIQRAGKRPMPAADFLRGTPVAAGADLGSPGH